MKKFLKTSLRFIGRIFYFFSRMIIRLLPYAIFRLLSSLFLFFGYLVMAQKKKLAMENLSTAFGQEKNPQELKLMMRECFRNIGRGMVELIYYLDRPQKVVEDVSIEGKEHLDKALSQGNGAIILSAHLGVFILMYIRVILAGYKTNVIMRRTRDEVFERSITKLRAKLQIQTIYALPQRQCIQDSIKALRRNEILFILLDQNYGGGGGVFVDFFGRKAATAAGPVVFSSRTKAPILPMFIVREASRNAKGKLALTNKHKVIIEPEIKIDTESKSDDVLHQNVQKLSNVIERYVRKYPYEWGGWMHKRWKTAYKG